MAPTARTGLQERAACSRPHTGTPSRGRERAQGSASRAGARRTQGRGRARLLPALPQPPPPATRPARAPSRGAARNCGGLRRAGCGVRGAGCGSPEALWLPCGFVKRRVPVRKSWTSGPSVPSGGQATFQSPDSLRSGLRDSAWAPSCPVTSPSCGRTHCALERL